MNVDSPTNIIDLRERGIVKGTCPIDGTTDSLNLIESANIDEVSIVGDEEGSADCSELRE